MLSKDTAAKIALVAIVGMSVALPLVAVASSTWSTPNLWGTPPGFWGPLLSCTGNYISPGSMTPCSSLCDLIQTAINIVYFGMTLALFVIAPVVIVIGAIMVMLAGANPEMLGKGKKAITGAVIGIVIVLCAYLVVSTVISVLNISGIGGFGNNSCSTNGGNLNVNTTTGGTSSGNTTTGGSGSSNVSGGGSSSGNTTTGSSGNSNVSGGGSSSGNQPGNDEDDDGD